MPHQCIECDRTFPDGSKEMLSGCPDCGGNKFQFRPASQGANSPNAGSTTADQKKSDQKKSDRKEPDRKNPEQKMPDPEPESERSRPQQSGAEPTGSASSDGAPTGRSDSTADADSSPRAGSSPDPTDTTDEASDPGDSPDTGDPTVDHEATGQRVHDEEAEDAAQASARSDVVSRDELDRARQDVPATEGPTPDDSEGPRPDVDELRSELNEQFESIRIVSPGQYELNLMELYDRQEYIISLQEDGRYVIEMPDAWGVED